jgi:hypothetical protein
MTCFCIIPNRFTRRTSWVTSPPSHKSTILWPPIPRPPQHYWKLWSSFIQFHISPYIQKFLIQWSTVCTIQYTPVFYKHRVSFHLYQLEEDTLTQYPLHNQRKHRIAKTYLNVPYQCGLQCNDKEFFPVDTLLLTQGIQVVANLFNGSLPPATDAKPQTLQEAFNLLPSFRQRLCGTVHIPLDNGANLIKKRQNKRKWGVQVMRPSNLVEDLMLGF